MSYQLDVSLRQTVVNTEEALLDLSQDDDGIVCTEERMSLVSIFEDEFIVNLPMVLMHELQEDTESEGGEEGTEEGTEEESKVGRCRVNHANDDSPIKPNTHRPFASLADMKNVFKRS